MKVTFELDPEKRYTVLKARFLPNNGVSIYDGSNIHHLGKDEAGFSVAWFALEVGESYCWRCATITHRKNVPNSVCPFCGGDFDD